MVRDLRPMLGFVASVGIAFALADAASAVAADVSVVRSDAAATVLSSAERHRGSRRSRIAASRRDSRIPPPSGNPDCGGVWYGRRFVLMVGIGY
jgi:hypothetical protein